MRFIRKQLVKLTLLVALCSGWTQICHAQFTLPPGSITAEVIRDSWNILNQFDPRSFPRTITLAEAQQLVPFYERAVQNGDISSYEALGREFLRLGLITDLGGFLDDVSGADQAAGSANAQVINNTIQTSIFEKAEPALSAASREKEKEKSGGAGAVTTVFGADAFYQRTELDGGAKIKGYGTNLSLTFGERFQFRGTVPLYRTEFGGFDATTYGLDLNGKYRVSENFAVGTHANYITNDSDLGDDKSWTAGVYAAMAAQMSEGSSLTFGVLFDRVKPDGIDEAWLGAAGLNWGVRVGRNTAFNPYVIYYRNFDTPAGADRDWYDVGAELQFNLSETWAFKTGLKTTLGQDGVDKSYQVYLGSAWRF